MKASFGVELMFLIAGPSIWLAHFLFIYTVNAIACARMVPTAGWLGLPASSWIIIAAGAAALAGMALAAMRQRARVSAKGAPAFHAWLTSGLCGLSAIAVVWETLPVLLLEACR
ncbi:hypothetical protein [Achromobacter arsenitoxydans]|uniref:Uncharacterized protein n=1 Tax=Achromobacter arsenitoxydans SY8 TaxID=477184 RepID=H0FBZ3_9BURK|nr:hypothetical protein [Achromobacter arsenitoxydans]EHK64269.1 hypothetical protein KYC_21511 [Achromobacter arsenitoxydans SY8]